MTEKSPIDLLLGTVLYNTSNRYAYWKIGLCKIVIDTRKLTYNLAHNILKLQELITTNKLKLYITKDIEKSYVAYIDEYGVPKLIQLNAICKCMVIPKDLSKLKKYNVYRRGSKKIRELTETLKLVANDISIEG